MSEGSLAQAFGALQAERARSWPPEQLAKNVAQRHALVDAFDPAAVVQVGDTLDNSVLRALDGSPVSLDELVGEGPAVLILFRYAECPADNIALPLYDAALADAGVPVVAISPQVPAKLAAIGERHALRLRLVSDTDNRLADNLRLTFVPADRPSPPPAGWIGEITGTDAWELPQTSVLIVDGTRTVRFVQVSPDWLDRIEPAEIVRQLAALSRELEPSH